LEKVSVECKIIEMEKAALDRWGKGDPSGFLEICADDVCYFDPFLNLRIDGLQSLTVLYESLRGKIFVDSYELINPKVQVADNTAILTFNYQSQNGQIVTKWNCTEVYRRNECNWKIIHTHWSFTKAE
jgi:hypothetical protein